MEDTRTTAKIYALSPETLEAHHHLLTQAQFHLSRWGFSEQEEPCADRIALLRSEIQSRRLEKHSGKQHQESIALETHTLSWARVAGIAGIFAVAIGAAALAVQIYFAKNPPLPIAGASPTPSPQTTPTISESPVQAEDSSRATLSPQPTAEIEASAPP